MRVLGFICILMSAHLTMAALPPGTVINTNTTTSCFPPRLIGFIEELTAKFGNVVIQSGYRDAKHNARVGGAKHSQHIHCNAVDFSIPGVDKREVRAYLAANFSGRAGIGYYCNNRFHLDVGTPRQWGGCQPSGSRSRMPPNVASRSGSNRSGSSNWYAMYKQKFAQPTRAAYRSPTSYRRRVKAPATRTPMVNSDKMRWLRSYYGSSQGVQ